MLTARLWSLWAVEGILLYDDLHTTLQHPMGDMKGSSVVLPARPTFSVQLDKSF